MSLTFRNRYQAVPGEESLVTWLVVTRVVLYRGKLDVLVVDEKLVYHEFYV